MKTFQDRMPGNHCFGCGPDNNQGLAIKSAWSAEDPSVAICHFEPSPHHCAAPTKFLNGGIIATIIDCHSVCTAVAHSYRAQGREIGQGEDLFFATGQLNITYRRPVSITGPILLRATVETDLGKKLLVNCVLESDGKECARAEVEAVQVSTAWMS